MHLSKLRFDRSGDRLAHRRDAKHPEKGLARQICKLFCSVVQYQVDKHPLLSISASAAQLRRRAVSLSHDELGERDMWSHPDIAAGRDPTHLKMAACADERAPNRHRLRRARRNRPGAAADRPPGAGADRPASCRRSPCFSRDLHPPSSPSTASQTALNLLDLASTHDPLLAPGGTLPCHSHASANPR